ncbi:hypothetical protein ACFQ1M_11565 [Sungkyunkwania multivorans]|uniref:Lipoprotein n=1 Tax=Sungkyunkwania multivorans TaxID=1173618 RepID=A0ABW3CZ97_9FLAO
MSIVLLTMMGCKEKDAKIELSEKITAQPPEQQKKSPPMQNKPIEIKVISTINYSESVTKYGKPKNTEDFLIDEALPESRIELYNIYTKDQYTRRNINIREAIWSLDSLQNITVWYEKDSEIYRPVHLLKWEKGSEF